MKKYRVEAFIIPSNIKSGNDSNQIDDEKLAIKLQNESLTSLDELKTQNVSEKEEESTSDSANVCNNSANNEQCSSEFSEVFFDINEHIYDEIITPKKRSNFKKNEMRNESTEYAKAILNIEEPIYDEPFVGNLSRINLNKNSTNSYDVPQRSRTLGSSKYRRFCVVAPKLPKRSTSLKSIVEDNESFDETLQEICCHGRKNGCSVNSQRPEDISEEIFKENWMQKLESLRKLETLLKDKEVALQSRERLLFKKEKELRILERLVKDKMKQAELYAKRYKKSLSSESISKASDDSKGHTKSEGSSGSSNSMPRVNSNTLLEKNEIVFRNPPNSRSSLVTDRLSSRVTSVRSRSRPRQKIRYDDLDSTLSADIGDSSFVITSKKFDPELFKRPAAFSRSASERRPRIEEQPPAVRLASLKEKEESTEKLTDKIEEKTLKKISENIIATKDQSTKFLNYGLIDEKSSVDIKNVDKAELTNQKRFSYLNLEAVNKPIQSKVTSKERPTSWSQDADDWLKKKRQAYNATKQSINENIADKENFDRQIQTNASIKINKKKENNRKKFSIFR